MALFEFDSTIGSSLGESEGGAPSPPFFGRGADGAAPSEWFPQFAELAGRGAPGPPAGLLMSKRESQIVAVILGVMSPYLAGVACWWTAAVLYFAGVPHLGERPIAIAAFAGLAVGIAADVLWLRRWVAGIYTANLALIGMIYLACSVVALASCMGTPPGNLLLGTLAGVYAGRRALHSGAGVPEAARIRRRGAAFTAAVTGTESFFIGLLALREDSTRRMLAAALRVDVAVVAGPLGVMVIVALVVVLIGLQFWCTSTAARIAFEAHRAADD